MFFLICFLFALHTKDMLRSKEQCGNCGLYENHVYERIADGSVYYACQQPTIIRLPDVSVAPGFARRPTFRERFYNKRGRDAPFTPDCASTYACGSTEGYGLCPKCHELGSHFKPTVSADIGYYECPVQYSGSVEVPRPKSLKTTTVATEPPRPLDVREDTDVYGLREPDDVRAPLFDPEMIDYGVAHETIDMDIDKQIGDLFIDDYDPYTLGCPDSLQQLEQPPGQHVPHARRDYFRNTNDVFDVRQMPRWRSNQGLDRHNGCLGGPNDGLDRPNAGLGKPKARLREFVACEKCGDYENHYVDSGDGFGYYSCCND